MNRIFEYTITPSDVPCTVGEYLKKRGYSRQIIIHLKKTEHGILQNGEWAYVRTPLVPGDVLKITLLEESASEHILPVPMEPDIVYEDEDLLVVNKPFDMPVHPSIHNYDNTLANGKDHPFAGRPYLHVSDLHNQNFILRERGSGTRAIFEAAMDAHHVPYEIKWESSSTPAILDAVSRNLGLGFVSERCATGKADAGLLFQCPVPEIDSERFFYLCYNSTHPMTSQMKDFSDYICSLPKDFN